MSSNIKFCYRFHPVGQGLFASGQLVNDRNDPHPFNWVFDCGSITPKVKSNLQPQIILYKELEIQDNYLDLLCISHFDRDHVNGLEELLRDVCVGTLVIPYYNPYECIILACAQSFMDEKSWQNYISFILNPVAYVIEHAASIGKIFVVYGDSDEDQAVMPSIGRPLNNERNKPEKPIHTDRVQFEDENSDNVPTGDGVPSYLKNLRKSLKGFSGIIYFAKEKFKLTCPFFGINEWEFLFFHNPVDKDSIKEIQSKIQDIITSNDNDICSCLQNKTERDKIKKVYGDQFRRRKRFNASGVCMYAGPVSNNYILEPPLAWTERSQSGSKRWYPLVDGCFGSSKSSVLYSGDANFTDDYINKLQNYLTITRWNKISILQVPHHGSADNWNTTIDFEHYWSVFCADPDHRFGHPHKKVLLQLRNNNHLIVDNRIGYDYHGTVLSIWKA